jgi:hypothetical protein
LQLKVKRSLSSLGRNPMTVLIAHWTQLAYHPFCKLVKTILSNHIAPKNDAFERLW